MIVLTTFDLDEYAFAAIRAGAAAFLLKDARPEDLLTAIRTVHAGDSVVAPQHHPPPAGALRRIRPADPDDGASEQRLEH